MLFFVCSANRAFRIVVFVLCFLSNNIIESQSQPQSPLISSFKEHSFLKSNTPYHLEWIQLGPTLNGARAEAIQADPINPGTIFAAFGSGGLWKTVDNGLSWNPIFENKPSLGIGDFALAPSNNNIIYVATGESLKKPRNFTMPGTGIYRSEDGGVNWDQIGLNDTWHVGEIVVHPNNPDIVLVAAQGHFWSSNKNRGIFRTDNGGKTWKHVLYIDENTGANDIVISPSDPQKVYASMWENYPDVNGQKSGVYKSDDGGKTWEKALKGMTITENTGRIGVAVSHQNKAYAFVDQRNQKENSGSGEIYKTTDGGESWTKTHHENIKSLSVIGWYFMDIYVNPTNDEEIYGLGVRLIRSSDGGKSFSFINGDVTHLTPSPAQTLHLDHCEMWINPNNPNELILANDGGIYHSYNRGDSWLHLNNIPTGEFYDIEIDYQDPYQIYGGTQDDATVFGPSVEYNSEFDDPWQYLWIDSWSGGDGCITLVDPNDSNTVYFSMQNGGAMRRNLKTGKSKYIGPRFKDKNIKIEYNFITPYMLSNFNSNTLYMGGNYLMKSTNRGDKWTLISPELVNKNSKEEIAAGAIAESYFDEGTLYFGTDRGAMWVTRNGGKDWVNISEGLSEQYIRSIQPSRHKKGRVYIQMTGLNYDELGAYLYVSEDYGNNWKPITNNLPNHPINVIVEDNEFENILYAGTYRGVYVSTNRGVSWNYLGNGLPDTSIADISIENRSKDLVIATHGRGIYKMNLKPFYDVILNEKTKNYLFDLDQIKAPKKRDTHRDIDKKSIKKVTFSYWMNTSENIKLRIKTEKDSLIWSTSINAKKGINQFRWDKVIREQSKNETYFIRYKEYIEKGVYSLIFESSEGIIKKQFKVVESN